MEIDTLNSVGSAALAARTTLTNAARTPAGGLDEPRMARVAQAAIFSEALLSALHARIAEFRTVAK